MIKWSRTLNTLRQRYSILPWSQSRSDDNTTKQFRDEPATDQIRLVRGAGGAKPERRGLEDLENAKAI